MTEEVLTVSEVEVVRCPSRPQPHGVDGVIHVPRHRGIVGQGEDHLSHKGYNRSCAKPDLEEFYRGEAGIKMRLQAMSPLFSETQHGLRCAS